MLTPMVSMLFGGPSITTQNDLTEGNAVLGRPVWDPRMLLAQLELRLGLPQAAAPEVVRLQRWTATLRELGASEPCFFSDSYSMDPLGTAKTLLEWRDDLALAGWNGKSVPGGGSRLDTLVELEARANLTELAPGVPDRLRQVVRELDATRARVFERVELAERRVLWPELWRQTFGQLERSGVPVETVPTAFAGAAAPGDLALLQQALRGELTERVDLVGDGSVVCLGAETAWELAQAVAVLLQAESAKCSVVVRGGDARALELALDAQGLASQGLVSRSTWRPALQVLPLALELAFVPRDPQRVFELVTLPEGPFRGKVGRELAKALAEAPGLGGRPWLEAKQRLRDAGYDELELERIAAWFEGDGHDALRGAPVAALGQVARRVIEWLEAELTRGHTALGDPSSPPGLEQRVQVLGAALGRARAFETALQQEGRALLRLVEARQVLEEASGDPVAAELSVESAGRMDHVVRPAGVRASRDVVLWWFCAEGTQYRPQLPPWRVSELRALDLAGVRFVTMRARLAAEAESWLAPVLAARRRLILASPRSGLGTALGPHPFVDELAARLTKAAFERIHVRLSDWLEAGAPSRLAVAHPGDDQLSREGPLPLPAARAEWVIDAACVPEMTSHSASSLEALATCPLKWLLRYGAGLYPAAHRSVPRGPLLYGKLGHRLVEELHACGALATPERTAERSSALFDRLIEEEAGVLLCSGQRSELVQLKAQLCNTAEALSRWLAGALLEIVGVEEPLEATWQGRTLSGRADLLAVDANGDEIVLDLKWGASRYDELLKKGMALQLAIYSRMRQPDHGSRKMPRSGYFSLGAAKPLTADNLDASGPENNEEPAAAKTWRRLEATVGLVEQRLATGRVAVTGVKRSLPMWADEDAAANDGRGYLRGERGAACTYCDYGAICGRSWEVLT